MLDYQHMLQLGPVLLGAKGAQYYQRELFTGWADFKRQVDRDFGLSDDQLRERFFGMTHGAQESDASFILRVEQQRRSIGAPADATLHCFKAKLEA